MKYLLDRSLLSTLCIMLLAIASCDRGAGGPGTGTSADTHNHQNELSTSDATYQLTDWQTGAEEESWEMSNGFMITQFSKAQVDSFKFPYANCIGYETSSDASITVKNPGSKNQFLICKSTKSTVVHGCGQSNDPMDYKLQSDEIFAFETLGSLCTPYLYHVKRKA